MEGVLAEQLERILRERVRLSAAGRTDAGVHARGQVTSFVTGSSVTPDRVQAALNGALAPEVVVTDGRQAQDGFDARFSATAREYRYVLRTAELPDPFTARYEWHRPASLQLGAMREAAGELAGEHDFAAFCRLPRGDRSTVRRLERLSVARRGERMLVTARANAFLHQMVRSLVGTLVAVGEGRMDAEVVRRALRGRDRALAGAVAPAQGLTLERVVYGDGRRRSSGRGALTSVRSRR